MQRMYDSAEMIRDMLFCTIGQDPNVCVGEVEHICHEAKEIPIAVRGASRAENLRAIVPREYQVGNTVITTKIIFEGCELEWRCIPKGNVRQVATLFCQALSTNRLFMGTVLPPEKLISMSFNLSVLIAPESITFFGPCPHKEWAADVFARVLTLQYGKVLCTHACFVNYEPSCHCEDVIYCGAKTCDHGDSWYNR
ncbi:MAG: hypothetical protein ACRCTE_14730 [Cellulosilyticaceae bacterium]